jgi:hypothetical protein
MSNNELFLEGRKGPQAKPLSLEYREWWKEQKRRCLEGYSVGGKFMPGELYFYVNFGTIELVDEKTGRKRRGRPLLRDVEWEVFSVVHEAKKQRKGLIWMTGRRGGKSFIMAALAAYELTFFPDSELCIGAYHSSYSTQTMDKVAWHLEGLRDTEFYHHKLKMDPKKEIRLGYEINEGGKPVKRGFNSRVYNIVFKDKHQAAVGKSASFFGFEEIGQFENLLSAFGASEPCWKEGSTWYGFPMLVGTGGDMEKGTIDAMHMFYNPSAYNLMEFKDEETGRTMGYFVPGWKVLNDFKDENGVTDKEGAIQAILMARERKKNSKDNWGYVQEIQYYPLTHDEIFLQVGSGFFPADLLQKQIEEAVMGRSRGIPGRLEWEVSDDKKRKVAFKEDYSLRQVQFPLDDKEDNRGAIVIYEFPEYDKEGKIPDFLYVAGTDPYAMDVAENSTSLGATYVFKRFNGVHSSSHLIVAEYVGRPETTEIYAENLRKLLTFYNAVCLYENNIRGIKEYFEQKNCLHLLAGQPKVIGNAVKNPKVSRTHGIHMVPGIKRYALNKILDYLRTEYEPGRFNVEKIWSVPLLKELLNYNEWQNFDRVVAFGLALLMEVEFSAFSENETSALQRSVDKFFRYYGL